MCQMFSSAVSRGESFSVLFFFHILHIIIITSLGKCISGRIMVLTRQGDASTQNNTKAKSNALDTVLRTVIMSRCFKVKVFSFYNGILDMLRSNYLLFVCIINNTLLYILQVAEYLKSNDFCRGFTLIIDIFEASAADVLSKINLVELQQFIPIITVSI